MKRMTVCLVLVAVIGSLTVQGADKKKSKPLTKNSSILEVMKKAEAEGIKNIILVELVDNKWLVETINENGKKESHIIAKVKDSEKHKVYAHKVTAPPKGVSIAEIIKKAQKENKGTIDEIKFVDGAWVVSFNDDDNDVEVIYNTDGKQLRKMVID